MNESKIQDDRNFQSESALADLAQRLSAEHALFARSWSCADERRETLAQLVEDSARQHGLGDESRDFLADCLNDEANTYPDNSVIESLAIEAAAKCEGLGAKQRAAVIASYMRRVTQNEKQVA